MNMATSELQRRSVRPRPETVRLERVSSVPADATVRHVDQLDSETLDAVYRAVADDRTVPADAIDLEAGEVIVFTDYYRVERA